MKNQAISKVPHHVALKINGVAHHPNAAVPWYAGSEPWPEPVQGRELLAELAQVFSRFVVLPEWGAEILALWTVHTYAFDLRVVTTYLGIESRNKRCGQTTLVTVLGALVNRPVMASQIRTVPLLRLIDENRLTLVVDNEESLPQGAEDLPEILNAGCKRSTAFIVKITNPGTKSITGLREASPDWTVSEPGFGPPVFSAGLVLFSAWCPKAMAAIGQLPASFAERYVTIRLRRKRSGEHCERLRNLGHFASSLRRKSVRFVLDHAKEIIEARPKIPPEMRGRTSEIWGPLLALAEVAGEPWPNLSREAAMAVS